MKGNKTAAVSHIWNEYARIYNKIAICLEKNKINVDKLQRLIDLAIRLENRDER
ncbi:MAG TPA: hypothetical protein PLZ84_03920 [Clostridia bacterium]|nr:hypothetical protein [Clostridia bacterium]